MASPNLNNKTVILNDPMLASGKSMVLAQGIVKKGKPAKVHIVAVIASKEEYLFKNHLPSEITLWVGAVDDEMTSQSYIVPGLGDAGDLAFDQRKIKQCLGINTLYCLD